MADFYNNTANTLVSGTSDADSIYNESSAEHVTIQSGDGNDTIINYAEHVTIYSGDGNNTIQNGQQEQQSNDYGFYSYIVAGNGNDSIVNSGRYSTIIGGDGNDYILSDVYGSHGYEDYRNVTVFGGAGNDTLQVNDNETSLNGGAGDDIVSVSTGGAWTTNTLQGGADNDTIYGNGNSNVVFYNAGDGDDSILGFANLDTIQIEPANADVSTVVSDGDLIFTINEGRANEGHMTIVGGGNLEIVVIYGSEAQVDLGLADSNTGVFVVSTDTLADGEVIFSPNAAFKAEIGSDDTIVGNVDSEHVYVAVNGDFRQSITVTSDWNAVATDKNDTIVITGNGTTVNAAGGNDVISVDGGSARIVYNDGDGNDTVYGYSAANTTLRFAEGITTSSVESGNNVIITATGDSVGSITLVEVDQYVDNTPNAGATHRVQLHSWRYGFNPTNSFISLSSIDDDALEGANDFATILSDGNDHSLWGGAEGDDTLVGTSGRDEFFYLKGNGNDVIENAGDDDLINLLNVRLDDIDLDSFPNAIGADSTTIKFNDGGSIKVNGTSEVGFKVAGVDCTFCVKDRQWAIK